MQSTFKVIKNSRYVVRKISSICIHGKNGIKRPKILAEYKSEKYFV